MKLKFYKSILLRLMIIVILLHGSAVYTSVYAEETVLGEGTDPSEQEYPRKLESKDGWEKLASLPGDIIYFPFKVIFKGSETTIAYVHESMIIPKVVDYLTSDDGLRGLRPEYSARSGGGPRLFVNDLLTEGSKLNLGASAGLRGRKQLQADFARIQLMNNYLRADLLLRYRFLSDESFFGIGPNPSLDDRTNFAHSQTTAAARLIANVTRSLSLEAKPGIEFNRVLAGRDNTILSTDAVYSETGLPGLETDAGMASIELTANLDSRDRPANPMSGSQALLGAGLFRGLEDSFGFYKLRAGFTHHLDLFYNRAIVLRIAAEFTEPMSGRRVPFYYLSELGSQETIRGFKRGRFRDRDMLLGSIEYRYPIWRRAVYARLFFDFGQVAYSFGRDPYGENLHTGVGCGIIAWGDDGALVRMTLGRSKDGIRFYLSL
ncbi:BamA/TamA family outer membrane protein [candidate division KSB1 bacterium]